MYGTELGIELIYWKEEYEEKERNDRGQCEAA